MTKPRFIFRCGMVLSLFFFCIVLPAALFAEPDESADTKGPAGLEPILGYIAKTWDTLTRSIEECTTVVDPKLAENSVLYLPAEIAVPADVQDLQNRCHIQVRSLPEKIVRPGQIDTTALSPQG